MIHMKATIFICSLIYFAVTNLHIMECYTSLIRSCIPTHPKSKYILKYFKDIYKIKLTNK